MTRPKHPNKELEATLRWLEDLGWRVERKRYFKAKCPCGKHQRQIHITPSNPNYGRQLENWIRRNTCAKGDEGR